jgi:DNA-binding NarL/FixJ family response regulator
VAATSTSTPTSTPTPTPTGAPAAGLRVLVVEDNVLLREGLTALLREHGIEVVDAIGDTARLAAVLDRAGAADGVDVAIMDIRLPPTFTDEGIRAAVSLRRERPGLGVLVLSQYVELAYTAELLAAGSAGVGYLLKERIGDVREFLDALHRVAAGGTALDREVIAELMGARAAASGPAELAALTAREREVLALMAEGRSNSAIAATLVVGPGAVEKHVSNIFAKLGLPAVAADHRRVLAVLTYLRAAETS